ncbi:hypothetical protein FB45DRAFT_902792 [Roridomyces roridus]|uniref:Enoyl reductase (ER) domain-containing protein n=1 Tax=Roridomyces roridus TaxID=1738132 RepID=A0AAD7C3V0_9AGAR|nr:hypothetical protein FB45DRAFT_902792 [Roridomyces roridus]
MPRNVPNPRIMFMKRPGDGPPVIGEHITLDTSRSIDLDNVPLNGGYLSKTLLISPEPATRERMRDTKTPSYTTTLPLGKPVVGFGLVVVLRSEKDGIKPGDHLYGMTPFEAYTVQPYVEGLCQYSRVDASRLIPVNGHQDTFDMDSLALQVVPDPQGAFPWTRYCGILGVPGLSAFAGFEVYANAKEGETIYVSSGAGGVGSLVVQLAKMKGMKVIASAGSDDKVEYMKKLGADIAFNYKTTPVAEVLGENPLDLYWDNVGGSQLEAAIDALKVHGRVIACGSSGDYNLAYEDRPPVGYNTTLIFKKRLLINGFLISDLAPTMAPRFFSEIPALLATGKMTSEEHLVHGIENWPTAFVDMLKGALPGGKPVVVVAQE